MNDCKSSRIRRLDQQNRGGKRLSRESNKPRFMYSDVSTMSTMQLTGDDDGTYIHAYVFTNLIFSFEQM